MPEFISNTSCLILLSKIDRIQVLNELYGSVTVTNLVLGEFGEEIPDFFIVKELKNKSLFNNLTSIIDPGEASTIALGLEIKDSTLILDDYKARTVAQKLNLRFTGTLGVLHKAHKSGLIKDLKAEIINLKSHGFWISDEIINSIT